MAKMFGNPMFTFMHTFLTYLIMYDWINNVINTTIMMYLGDVFVLVTSLCSAAYLIYKTTQATISFVNGFAY